MKNRLTITQKRLLDEFPEIDIELVKKIDIDVMTKIIKHQSSNINEDISRYLQNEVKHYIKTKNSNTIKEKCDKLVNGYLENNRVWYLQENWYCLLAYFITIATLVMRLFDLNSEENDKFSICLYFFVILIWLIIVNGKCLMGLKAEIFLLSFNHHAPSWIIISSLLFYMVAYDCQNIIIMSAVIVIPFVACIWLTWLWYKRLMKY